MVSVILTVYARPENLDLQLKHINNQSIKPDEIIIVVDFNADINFNLKNIKIIKL